MNHTLFVGMEFFDRPNLIVNEILCEGSKEDCMAMARRIGGVSHDQRKIKRWLIRCWSDDDLRHLENGGEE